MAMLKLKTDPFKMYCRFCNQSVITGVVSGDPSPTTYPKVICVPCIKQLKDISDKNVGVLLNVRAVPSV